MEKPGLEKFRSLLSEMKSRLVSQSREAISNECIRGDEGDVAQNHLNVRLSTQLFARNSAHLKRIEAALKRIDSGSFGNCTECEEEIDEKRLESRPITTLCASCKEDEERLQSGFVGTRRKIA